MVKMSSADHIKLHDDFVAPNYHPLPVVLSEGEGIWVKDVEGRTYIDCLSGYSALNQGHSHPKIIEALVDQVKKLSLTGRGFYNDQLGLFLEKLCKLTGYEMALPMNTGAEAVESAIKIARKWGYETKGIKDRAAQIITCTNNFHGRTTTIISFSSSPDATRNFGPYTPGFKMIPYGDIEALEANITPETVGFLIEPIQGEGGIVIPPAGFMQAAYDLCKRHNVLFIADEIQTGLGRTGHLLASDYDDIKPDLVILGKSLSGGLYPVSAVLGSKSILSLLTAGTHGSTYSGNPLGAAIAIAALDVLVDEKLIENAKEMGNYLIQSLKNIKSPHIKEVRGRGLMVGVELNPSYGTAWDLAEKLVKQGVLTKDTKKQTLRMTPPLIVQPKEIDLIVDATQKSLESN